jgi:biopolymer transport protein ExbD
LIIKAAKEVPHGDVVRLMVMAKEAGIENQAFATRPVED